MKKLTKLLLIFLVAAFQNSCATTYKIGNQYATKNVARVIIGKTSESDILRFFGDPWKIGLLNGNVVYTYCYEEIVFYHDDSVNMNGNTLIIEFDENRNVLNYYFNIPGKGPSLLSLMMHKKNILRQQQEQVAWQNNRSTIPSN